MGIDPHDSRLPKPREVMVVDDDRDVCDALATLIEVDGYRPATFTAGLDALRYVRESSLPGLILVDLSMPVLNGWQFLEQLSQIPRAERVPAFLMSADTRLDEAEARRLGARGVLRKPFDLPTLSRVLRNHCGVGP